MPHECVYTGRRTKIGRQCTYRGKAKYLGGVGIKITGRSARKFKPNLQKVRVILDGKPQRSLGLRPGHSLGPGRQALKRSLTYKHKKAEA